MCRKSFDFLHFVLLLSEFDKNIQKIVMDVKEEGSLEVIPTVIEKPAEDEKPA